MKRLKITTNIMAYKVLIAITILLLGPTAALSQSDLFTRELWSGTFEQTAPMRWSGHMELYLRYDPEDDEPIPVEGLITWKDLGKARTKIRGTLKKSQLQFTEESCVEGDCSKIVVGGNYSATINSSQTELKGSAKGQFGLEGNFSLKKERS